MVTALGLTEAEERAIAGATTALIEFVNRVVPTPALAELTSNVVDVPWWRLLGRRGHRPDLGFSFDGVRVGPVVKPEPGDRRYQDLYRVPDTLRLEGQPGLDVSLVVRIARSAGLDRRGGGVGGSESRRGQETRIDSHPRLGAGRKTK